jgi:hypothetical protein
MRKIVSWVSAALVVAGATTASYLLIFPWDLRPVSVPGSLTERDPVTGTMILSFVAVVCALAAFAAWARTPVWLIAVACGVPATCLFVVSCVRTDWPDAPLWPVDVPFVFAGTAGASALMALATRWILLSRRNKVA